MNFATLRFISNENILDLNLFRFFDSVKTWWLQYFIRSMWIMWIYEFMPNRTTHMLWKNVRHSRIFIIHVKVEKAFPIDIGPMSEREYANDWEQKCGHTRREWEREREMGKKWWGFYRANALSTVSSKGKCALTTYLKCYMICKLHSPSHKDG